MTIVREPLIAAVAIGDLRPTQITVGMREVATKRKRWHELGAKKDEKFLGKHIIPVVLGPKQRPYVVDHHHLARALHDEGVKEVAITVGNNLSGLDREAFWTVMDNRDWMHPYDAEGVRRPYRDIPKTVAELIDDPFRSLAGELRRAGGFAKDTTPFSEFLLGGLFAPPRQAKTHRTGLRPCGGSSAGIGEKPGSGLFARMVWSVTRGLTVCLCGTRSSSLARTHHRI